MGVNVSIYGPKSLSTGTINPAVQDNRWLISFPYNTEDKLLTSFSIGSDVTRVNDATYSASETKVGTSVEGFARDWYNRIHITPASLDVGNLMSLKNYEINVWNAFFSQKTLGSLLESADSGMLLTQPSPAPLVYNPLQIHTYNLRVDVSGPPVVSGSYLFDFGFIQITFNVFGKRVVVWPFQPQEGVEESLEWKTDVIRYKAGEQRIALRDAPRQSLSYRYFMNDEQVSIARAMAYGWAHRQFGVPVWTEWSRVGQLAEASSTISFDTTGMTLVPGESVFLWESSEKYEATVVATVSAGGVTLVVPTSQAFENAYACPLRYAKCPQGFKFKRGPNNLIQVEADFQVTINYDFSAGIGLVKHSGLDVLTDTMYYLGDYTETVIREVETFDNGIGNIYSEAKYDYSDQKLLICFSTRGKAELKRVKQWLYSLKGKQKAFWLPSRSNDLTLVSNADSTSQVIHVKSIGYGLYYTTRAIRIVRKNGTITYHNVTGGATNGGVDSLSFDALIGVTANVSDVATINFLHKVRLDTDRIEIKHEDAGYATIKVPVIEVPN